MPPFGDILSRLFSSGRTQGLSGSVGSVAGQDASSVYYASRMRKHVTDADLLTEPGALWTSHSPQRGAGLAGHLQAEGASGRVDALVILNAADAERVGLGTSTWGPEASAALSLTRPGLRVRVVSDGSPDTGSEDFGLGPGEFITVLSPNLYLAPRAESRAVIAVHVNLPGVWEGYRELGRLWSDQTILTLGRHWLDNVRHPDLREAALYRLQQQPDGSLVHLVSPELQDVYEVRSDTTEAGVSVLTLAERDGAVVAYVVLALVEDEVSSAVGEPPRAEVGPSTEDAAHAQDAAAPADGTVGGAPGVADVGPDTTGQRPIGLDSAAYGLETGARARRMHRTVVPDEVDARILALQERGALLQRVHFAQFMEGYDVFIGAGGRVSTQDDAPRATLSVRGDRVTLVANAPGVRLDGLPIAVRMPTALVRDAEIEVDGHALHYRDLSRVSAAGWPYLGELRRPGPATYLAFGERHRIGRDRRCKVRLPDEPHNENIVWKADVDAGGTIRALQGDIPKSRFYTDSIMVASEHAEVDLSSAPLVRSLARSCCTFVRRDGMILPLAPTKAGGGSPRESDLRSGDELLVGNCLFAVSYAPVGAGARAPGPATLPPVVLASPVDTTAPLPPQPRVAHTVDVVAAAGLGERGPAPRPPSAVAPALPTLPPAIGTVPSASGSNQPPTFPFPRVASPAPVEAAPASAPAEAPPYALAHDDGVPSIEAAHGAAELASPARLALTGWSLDGSVVVGNHEAADICLPELRAFPEQAFMTLDYFRVAIEGGTALVELLQPGEARVVSSGVEVARADGSDAALSVSRRDENFDVAFELPMRVVQDATLGGPYLALDASGAAAAGLFAIGLSPRVRRRVRFATSGSIEAEVVFEGNGVRVFASSGTALRVSRAGARFRPLAPDGALLLCRGDRLQVGRAVYRVEIG